MKQIIVNVSGLSVEEKQRVNEALAKITGAAKLPVINPKAAWFLASALPSDSMIVVWGMESLIEEPTHTPQQVLEMAGMAKQGHKHAEMIALCAEFAQTMENPMVMFQFKDCGVWVDFDLDSNLAFYNHREYRLKPKTHTVNGVEVPDLRFVPCDDQYFYKPEPYARALVAMTTLTRKSRSGEDMIRHNLCYEYTEAGKQAAILHAKAWLGIA